MKQSSLYLLIFVLAFISCTKKPDFAEEKQAFFNEANARGCLVADVDVYFAHLDGTTAGYCVPNFGILIDIERWNGFGPYQRKEVLWHEYAHCVFGAEHTDFGLMEPAMHSEQELELMWHKYVDLLFKDCLTVESLIEVFKQKKLLIESSL